MYKFKFPAIAAFLTLLLQGVNSNCFSQKDFISGLIIDRDTESPIPFTNVGIKNKFIGTVSDSHGYFKISINTLSVNDTIEISRLGYDKEKMLVKKLMDPKSNPRIILLQQKAVDLDEFTVTAESAIGIKTFGNLTLKSRFAFAFNPIKSRASENFGREVAVKVDPKKKSVRINTVKFALANNQFDHLVFRVNVYKEGSDSKGFPGERIFEKIVEVNNEFKGEYMVPFEHHDIVLDGKFWVSMEFLDYRDEQEFGIVTVPVKLPFGKMYSRESSLGEWKQVIGSPSILIEAEVFDP
ncbi:carboxypeptidase-like regulatory domain-containing protein [Litoribacter alkaliphilus]|uniref:Carboxypeptidase-like regulatory domain-containing protein n=1 Tax=Litoribacter ruber TaxID=702568 RepID=A0AAP2CDV0_9BACT|nr:carboxypeptidase-like regulatory domain-containing protein [Litoribacter alkaliphilus]MBS9522403.1 carboxypeptidase-like regulatory domain-containing protein [Litoribacter alkaliphilus]